MEIAKDLHYNGYQKAAETIDRFLPDIRNYQAFPKQQWRRIRTTNLMERVNKEIKRRSRVVGAFPFEDSRIRLIGSIIMDINEDWVTGIRYLIMDPYFIETPHEENGKFAAPLIKSSSRLSENGKCHYQCKTKIHH